MTVHSATTRARGTGIVSEGARAASRALVVLALTLLFCAEAAAQKPAATIGFGFAAGRAGRTVTIPLSLQRSGDEPVVRVVSRIRFPAADATFERLEEAALRQGEDAVKVVWELRDAEPPTDSTVAGEKSKTVEKILEVRVSSQPEGRPITDGIFAFLVFRIESSLAPETTPEIPLAHEALTFASGGAGAAPRAAAAEPGKILLETREIPIISCFFYLH